MPTYTATQLQESYPRCPHCACSDLAELVQQEILSFELFHELDDLKLQEVLVELMREGAPGLFLQQAPLSVRDHVRENLSSYNRDRLDEDLRVTVTDAERREAIDRTARPAWVMQLRGDVSLKLPEEAPSAAGRCPVCKRATIAVENLRGLAHCPECSSTGLFDSLVQGVERMAFIATMPPGMVSEFTRRYLNHIHVRSLAVLFKPASEEELQETLAKFPRGLRMDVQDRMAAIEPPGAARTLAASHHVLAAVFTQCFDPDLDDVGFTLPAYVGPTCGRCGGQAGA
ncbi:MAG: hypothetical protein QGG72_11950 [Verrucomicrobiota bacterium]|nr:hypothetical protein [Verrucomicrobiota bacterium]